MDRMHGIGLSLCDKEMVDGKEAFKRLMDGNYEYLKAKVGKGDISEEMRVMTHVYGQKPYAIVITCSDSRVIPEKIFMVGIGEIFVIRVAGNVIGEIELGTIEYAISHLGVKLIMVMGHTRCGAVDAAIHNHGSGYVKCITDRIKSAIGDETDPIICERLNIENSVKSIKQSTVVQKLIKEENLMIVGGNYHTRSGEVVIFD